MYLSRVISNFSTYLLILSLSFVGIIWFCVFSKSKHIPLIDTTATNLVIHSEPGIKSRESLSEKIAKAYSFNDELYRRSGAGCEYDADSADYVTEFDAERNIVLRNQQNPQAHKHEIWKLQVKIQEANAEIQRFQQNRWYRFGQLSRKRKIWVIGKVLSKKFRIYKILRFMLKIIKYIFEKKE